MLYISNSFSLGMLEPNEDEVNLRVTRRSLDDVKRLLSYGPYQSAVGHEATAQLLERLLGKPIRVSRAPIRLRRADDDAVLVFQLRVRLEEGKVLTAEELEALPYAFYLVEFL